MEQVGLPAWLAGIAFGVPAAGAVAVGDGFAVGVGVGVGVGVAVGFGVGVGVGVGVAVGLGLGAGTGVGDGAGELQATVTTARPSSNVGTRNEVNFLFIVYLLILDCNSLCYAQQYVLTLIFLNSEYDLATS